MSVLRPPYGVLPYEKIDTVLHKEYNISMKCLHQNHKIQLTQGKISVVDCIDYERVSQYKWHISSMGYARRNGSRGSGHKVIYLHRFLMGFPRLEIDHANGDKLDNRRENLRVCTHTENMRNRRYKMGRSKYRGVWFQKNSKKFPWISLITINNKRIYLGKFENKQKAAKAYNESASKYFGKFAVLNPI